MPPRPPAAAADRENRSKGQERQTADLAGRLAQQAYQQSAPAQQSALLAQDLMTSPVTWLPSDSMLLEAWTVMKRKEIHRLSVTSVHGTLVGMVTNHDLLPYAHELESVNSPRPSTWHKLAYAMSNRVLSATSTM